MNSFKEYDITTLFPGSMRACSMRDAGALWSYSDFVESMGMYFSVLNHRWLVDSAVYGDDREDLFLIPACITYKDDPEQYVVVSETTLRQTLSLLNSGQSCVWESSELESGYIVQAYAKDNAPEEAFVGELSSNHSNFPSNEELQRVRDVLKSTELAYYLIGKLNNSQVFLYMFQKDFVDAN